MSEIMGYIITVLGSIWNGCFNDEYMSGWNFKKEYIFLWVSLIIVEFVRVMIFCHIEESLDAD